MKYWLLLAIILSLPGSATAWQANPDNKLEVAVQETIDAFLAERPELTTYFKESWGYAVFPRVLKGGAMFGAAWGKGLVIEQDRPAGRCSQFLGSLGAQLGAQSYRQLILFRTEAALAIFKQGRIEFEGRASAVVVTAGASVDPANLPDVAIFSQTQGGLMFEAAAAGVKYSYKPLQGD